jgi:hypothetical protein
VNLDAIKSRAPLASKPEWVFLSSNKPIVSDIAGNPMGVGASGDYLAVPLAPGAYVYDTTPPSLTEFSLDMDAGKLLLTFSETVSVHFLNISGLCLQRTSRWASPYRT